MSIQLSFKVIALWNSIRVTKPRTEVTLFPGSGGHGREGDPTGKGQNDEVAIISGENGFHGKG